MAAASAARRSPRSRPCRRRAQQRHVAALAERHRGHVLAPVGLQQRLVRRAPRPSRRARGPRSARPWPPRSPPASPAARGAPGPTLTITPTSGSAIAVSSAICPAPRIAISSTSASVSGGRVQDGQRQPDLGVEVLAGSPRCRMAREQRREDVLGRGLAGRAGDADDLAPLAPSSRRHARPAPAARQRVVGREQHARAWRSAPPPRARAPPAPPGAGGSAPGAERRRRWARRSARRTDRPAAARASRSRRGAGPTAAGARGGQQSALRRPARLCSAVHIRARTPVGAQRLARDRHVVEGQLAPVRELLALLVALAGDHDDVARAARPPARSPRGDRDRASRSDAGRVGSARRRPGSRR